MLLLNLFDLLVGCTILLAGIGHILYSKPLATFYTKDYPIFFGFRIPIAAWFVILIGLALTIISLLWLSTSIQELLELAL